MAILVFFVVHWQLSVFCQSFYLHRYGAHRQFSMSKPVERFFHLLTFFAQGSSYLSPRGYAILHRMHHAYSDTAKDPHSPHNHRKGPFRLLAMMLATKKRYDDYAYDRAKPEPRFDGGTPSWPLLDWLGQRWAVRIAFGTAYTLFYMQYATQAWMYVLLPIQYIIGPVQGAIVNFCGHMYGYRNFDGADKSKNTLVFDFVTGGELFQNNHHKFGQSPRFAVRWFEVDTTYLVIRALGALRIIDTSGAQVGRWDGGKSAARLEADPAE